MSTPLRRPLTASQETELEHIRIASALQRIYEAEGFTAAIAALDAAARRLAEDVRRSGVSTGAWIG